MLITPGQDGAAMDDRPDHDHVTDPVAMDERPAAWLAALPAAALPAVVVLAFDSLEHIMGEFLGHPGGGLEILAVVSLFILAWIPGIPILAWCAGPAQGGVIAGAYVALVMAILLLPVYDVVGPLLPLIWVLFAALALAAGAIAGGLAAWSAGSAGGGLPALLSTFVLAVVLFIFAPPHSSGGWAWLVPMGLGVLGMLLLWRQRIAVSAAPTEER